jgi:6-phosphogluconolactonase
MYLSTALRFSAVDQWFAVCRFLTVGLIGCCLAMPTGRAQTPIGLLTNTPSQAVQSGAKDSMIPFYIGTYTSGQSKGIHRCLLDTKTGQLQGLELVAQLENPSFLTIHPTLDVLYACSEVRRDGKREGAQLMAYQIGADGGLTALGGQPSGGNGPCYVSTDQTGKVALVANYGSGSIASLPIAADGKLLAAVSTIQHAGKSVNPQRQEGPHAHCIMTDPSNRYVVAVDLGLDQVLVYALDAATGKLDPQPAGNYHAKPGNGPRHIAFHPSGKYAFIIHEIGNELSLASWDSSQGKFTQITSASTLPSGFAGDNSTAEVLVHPNGKYVYGSNRGHDSIALFAFDDAARQLTPVAHASTAGKTPRNFRIDPTGQFLLAENQASDSIVVFRIDSATGKLTQVGQPLTVGNPCCIKFHVTKK